MIYKMASREDFSVITKSGGTVSVPSIAEAPQFNARLAYAVGDKVYSNNIRYACIAPVEAPDEGAADNPLPSQDSEHWKPLPAVMALLDDIPEIPDISDRFVGFPVGNYADMDAIAERLDGVIRILKGCPHGRTMYFKSLEDGSTVAMQSQGASAPGGISLEYLIGDSGEWAPFVVGSTPVTLAKGEWVRIRATADATHTRFGRTTSNYNHFVLGGALMVGGNSMSLFYHDEAAISTATNFPDPTATYTLGLLFSGCTALRDASDLILPADYLPGSAYNSMFKGCSELKSAPSLPAEKLGGSCYADMFRDCSSLTTAPVLPAETLANYCYRRMFQGCTNLAVAPDLPAATLAMYCYEAMFKGCTSLTTAPVLRAEKMSTYCYQDMFLGCTGLTTAPVLPAETLASNCYNGMFQGCTSLAVAPDLPAETLVANCYQDMFSGCTNLTAAPELPAGKLASRCYLTMFQGCTSLTTAPVLPAETLSIYCYYGMFQGCTSLTTAPVLPAEKLAGNCYNMMFSGCSGIASITADFAAFDPNTAATTLWLEGVAEIGEFHCKPELVIPEERTSSSVPEGWTIVTDR